MVTIIPWWLGTRATLTGFWRDVATSPSSAGTPISARVSSTPANLVFFVAATAVFLFLTVKVLESRRWK
jgi:hypothetical protein